MARKLDVLRWEIIRLIIVIIFDNDVLRCHNCLYNNCNYNVVIYVAIFRRKKERLGKEEKRQKKIKRREINGCLDRVQILAFVTLRTTQKIIRGLSACRFVVRTLPARTRVTCRGAFPAAIFPFTPQGSVRWLSYTRHFSKKIFIGFTPCAYVECIRSWVSREGNGPLPRSRYPCTLVLHPV